MANKWTFRTLWGGQIEAQTVEKGKTVTKPEDPTKDGVGFGGWLLDGKLYDFSKPVTSNITLKAAWGIASSGNNFYQSLEEAVAATQTGTIKLLTDINATSQIVISNSDLILDMNGKTISNTTDIWNEAEYAWSFISVQENAKLTITGNGTFDAKENDCYAIDLRDGGKLTIENGIYKGNCHAIYVFEGSLFVNGGEFSVKQKFSATKPDEFVLNCYDPNYKRKDIEPREYTNIPANIEVSGGTFHGFNPGNCQAEGVKTDFLKPGYISIADESDPTIFKVVPITEKGQFESYSDVAKTFGCAIDKIMSNTPDDTVTQNIEDNGETFVILFDKTTVSLNPTDLEEFGIQTESNITVVLQGKMIMHGNLETETIEYVIYDFRSNTSINTNNHKLYTKVLYGNDYPEELIIDDKIITDFRSSTT